jgi:phosphate transport system substrate-binding protein
MRRSILLSLSLALAAGPRAATPITVKGSDTMVILNQRWAEAYMKTHPDVIVQVTGGGSGTGISALISGSTDVCAASRPMKPEEADALKKNAGGDRVEIPVAKDGIAIYLNQANGLDELSLDQLREFFTGRQTRWSAAGGPDQRVILYSRENNSGTYVFFKEHVLKNKDFSDFALTLPGTAAIVNAVSRDPRGIGYGGSSSRTRGIKTCAIRSAEGKPAYQPTKENILSGRYPISRNLYYYTRPEAPEQVKRFIEWILGPEGQLVVEAAGYFPVQERKAK